MPKKNRGVREYPSVNIRLRPETHKKLKLVANLLDKPMLEVFSDAVDMYLKDINVDDLYQQRIENLYN